MKSIKLTRDLKDRILSNIRTTFITEHLRKQGYQGEAELQQRIDELDTQIGIALWQKAYGVGTLEHLKLIPKKLQTSTSQLRVNISNGEFYYIDLPEEYRCSSSGADISITLEEYEDLEERVGVRQFKKARDACNRKVADFMATVRGVFESANTTKQLIELWPEVREFIPQDLQDPSTIRLPMVCTTQLNSALGLTE